MALLSFLKWINCTVFAFPTTILFLGVAIILTLKTRFIQIRAFPYFVRLLTKGFARRKRKKEKGAMKTISSFHALFTAMATTIGMGNVVGPSIAIMIGGPGALFWLLVYIFFGAVTKFAEVTFALFSRIKTADGHIIGGPMQYLKGISPILAGWYSVVMLFLFAGWSGLQANTLANIFALENVPQWHTGIILAILVFVVMRGGAKRVGMVASRLVPIMFLLYVSFALLILFKDYLAVLSAIKLVARHIFSPAAPIGGFLGASLFKAIHSGIYKGIFVTEAGIGTASIPHSIADTKYPVDQGILAMFSMLVDAFLCSLSGLLVLVTGVWMRGEFRSTLMYEIFKMNSPAVGRIVLLISIALFVFTTIIGNCFNGTQSFAALTKHRWVKSYIIFALVAIFFSSLMQMRLMWEMMDILLMLAAIPNVIGILILTFKKPKVLTA